MIRTVIVDDEIANFAEGNDGRIVSILPLLDHLSRAHPETSPDELLVQVDAAFERLYCAGRALFAGHRWLSDRPATVAGFLTGRRGELGYDAATRTWAWSETQWTENVTVR